MAANEESPRVIAGALDHHVRPADIQLTNGAVTGRLGKYEVEKVAGQLVEFFQSKDRWCAFTLEQLRKFYVLKGWNPNTMLFGLTGIWFDDGDLMGGWVEAFPYLAFTYEGLCYVTDVFIERCVGTYERPA